MWKQLSSGLDELVCNNYVIVETYALVQRRLGLSFVRRLEQDLIPFLHVHWVQPDEHEQIVGTLLLVNRRDLSFVDCASFDTMRRLGLHTAFTFDAHFADQGFTCLPGVSTLSRS